jgi:hypothetical protein
MERAVHYYVLLLGLRKKAFQIARLALQDSDAAPTDEEVETYVQKMVQDRGWMLARKGRDGASKPNLLADEITIVRAVVYALTTGHETSVLTRDRDLVEQFYKFVYVLDTHYRNMLIADAYHRQPLNFLETEWPNPGPWKQAFQSGCLLHIPPHYDHRVLPDAYDPVNVHVYRFGGNDEEMDFTSLGFCAEQQMTRLLEVKGNTAGRSTDRFGDKNLHRCVHPLSQEIMGEFVAIAKDQTVHVGGVDYSVVDTDLATSRTERRGEIRSPAPLDAEDDAKEVGGAWTFAQFQADRRLGFSPTDSWFDMSDRQLAHVVHFVPCWSQFFTDSPFLSAELPSAFRNALSQSRLVTTVDAFRDVESSNRQSPQSLAQLALHQRRDTWPRRLRKFSKEHKLRVAFDHYLALLGHRKLFGIVVERQLRDELGRPPTEDEWCREIRSIGRGDGFLRAREGRERYHDANLFDDEILVITAVFDAILEGGDTIILTRRRVVMEQFATLCKTLDRHYRSWAIAQSKAAVFADFVPRDTDELRRIGFSGSVRVGKYTAADLDDMLPDDPFPVQVQCWLFDGPSSSLRVFPVAFLAERPMHRLLEIKSRTGGASTDRLGDLHLHFTWETGASGLVGKTYLGRGLCTSIGSTKFPGHDQLDLEITKVPTFDLFQIENFGDGYAFPWSIQSHAVDRRRGRRARRRQLASKRK